MLSPAIKDEIQTAYKRIVAEKQLRPRLGQRLMIAEIARSLSAIDNDESSQSEQEAEGPVCVIEAGTGTGKTLAYILGTLPLARHLGKKVVLATATVALQEQVTQRDLPDICKYSGLSFSSTLAKGRGRYVCLSRLDQLLQENASQNALLELFGEVIPEASAAGAHKALYQTMLDSIGDGSWQGDRDDWDELLSEEQWRPVTVEAGQCAGQKCSNFSRCCFYKAREQVQSVDCIVANHDLVLVDLALGGGAVLPAPEDTIYIFDEAHHLPIKANQHFSASTRLRGSVQWMDTVNKTLQRLAVDKKLSGIPGISREASELESVCKQLTGHLNDALLLFEASFSETVDKFSEEGVKRYPLGVLPGELRELSVQLAAQNFRLVRGLKEIVAQLRKLIEQADTLEQRQQAEQWFPVLGAMATRAEDNNRLWQSFASEDDGQGAPVARWLSRISYGEIEDLSINSSPVLADRTLQEHLWSRCAGAVLTSATLSALGNFDVLRMRAGLPEHTVYHRIESPFDYAGAATLAVPRMNCDPGNSAAHTEAIIQSLPRVIDRQEATLVLFSSRRQMQDVLSGLESDWHSLILCQDDYQKAQLLTLHRQRVDKGEGSVIFGLASFAEGVDLPGNYCRHVIIAKIPFSVPNDPIESTLSQWLEESGKNPFMTLSVPEAAFRLVQATGRLLRSETDSGRITIFDPRLITRRYGKDILDSLPPFTRQLNVSV
ncbi:ATP-dependent DNA helicase DinG [Pseudohongiella spirulinae]|uniref:ATP-dependent DNA helicase DinG n=1 Tax=Pseudohongiella spirulinae TaxID=1249552 RepID=A0A0S2KCH2_9GAMM|nr:ATP-dependent DNA helicase DinG [Pseudohongiella spirulinae]ALO46022.1 Helicase c2 [Pseudohongiella spirulinae]